MSRPSLKKSVIVVPMLLMSMATGGFVAAQAVPEATPEATLEVLQAAHPFLGIHVSSEDGTLVISRVREGSAAEEAGLLEGDVITAVNGTEVTSASEIADLIATLSVGDTVIVDYTRDGETASVELTLTAEPAGRGGRGPRGGNAIYSEADQSWQIAELSEESPLYVAGFRTGDVITAINGEQYDNETLRTFLDAQEDDATLTITVERDGEAEDVDIAVSEVKDLFRGNNGPGGGRGGNRPGQNGAPNNPPSQGNPPDRNGAPGRNAPPADGSPQDPPNPPGENGEFV